jgi:hypothetical protein
VNAGAAKFGGANRQTFGAIPAKGNHVHQSFLAGDLQGTCILPDWLIGIVMLTLGPKGANLLGDAR